MTTNVNSKLFKDENTQWVIPCNPAISIVCRLCKCCNDISIFL